jgi:hypothetical protein
LADDALFATSGAVITSRKVYDRTKGWGKTGFYRMPVFVLTHRPQDVVVKGEATFTLRHRGGRVRDRTGASRGRRQEGAHHGRAPA